MKTIANSSNDAQWDSKLFKDLSFIKKKLRYPLTAKTLAPVLMVAVITVLIAFVLLSSYIHNQGAHKLNYNLPIFFAVSFIPITVSIVRYVQSLKFISIPTQYFGTENMALIEKFLKAQHLAVFHHPEAPEVFQIISKSIDQYKDKREVMIFIADDKRILVNSHFTNQGFILVPAAPHRKEMSIALQKWIANQYVTSNTDKITIAS
jgi:hypothetical protein